MTRPIATHYTDADDVERDITVDVSADGLRDVTLDGDLPDMPPSELERLIDRASELYWAAERLDYEMRTEGTE